VSVVVPVRNEGRFIGAQLAALADQDFDQPWELVVVDHGSTDDTCAVVRSWQSRLPNLVLDHAPHARGVGEVRNHGVTRAAAELLLFCDGDNVVDPSWMTAMVDALGTHDVVTGRNDLSRLNPPERRDYVTDPRRARRIGTVSVIRGGNFGVRRAVWDKLGGQVDDVGAGEDVDFGIRADRAGFPVHYVDGAVSHRRLPDTARGVFRQHRNYGISQVLIARKHPGVRGRPRFRLVLLRDAAFLVLRAPWLFRRTRRFRYAMVAGRLAGQVTALVRVRVRWDRPRRAAS
jgi:glycosyltransferase involved in cell wall biosynthesis